MPNRPAKSPTPIAKKILSLKGKRTYDELAAAWGEKAGTIRSWAGGYGSPKARTVAKIAQAEGLDVADLLAPEPLPALSLGHGIAAAQRTIAEAEARVAAEMARSPLDRAPRMKLPPMIHVGDAGAKGEDDSRYPGEDEPHMVAADLVTGVVRIRGRSAEPVALDGQHVLFETETCVPLRGDAVVIALHDGSVFFKRFVGQDDGFLVFGPIGTTDGCETVRVRGRDLARCHRFAGVLSAAYRFGDVPEARASGPEDFFA